MTGTLDQAGEEPTTGIEMESLIGEMTSLGVDTKDGKEIGSEPTGTEMENLTLKTVGEDLVENGPLELGIQPGEVMDGDQILFQLEKFQLLQNGLTQTGTLLKIGPYLLGDGSNQLGVGNSLPGVGNNQLGD